MFCHIWFGWEKKINFFFIFLRACCRISDVNSTFLKRVRASHLSLLGVVRHVVPLQICAVSHMPSVFVVPPGEETSHATAGDVVQHICKPIPNVIPMSGYYSSIKGTF